MDVAPIWQQSITWVRFVFHWSRMCTSSHQDDISFDDNCFTQKPFLKAVRREVGVPAKLLNKTVLFKPQIKPHTNGNNDSIVNARVATPTFMESEACVPQLSIFESKSTCRVNSSNPSLYLPSENRPNAALSHMVNDPIPHCKKHTTQPKLHWKNQ